MSHIKSKNTKPEVLVRRFLFAHGFRFRLHRKDLPGKPDIVLPKYKTVIFINGCFWHGHEGCRFFRLPKTNIDFWQNKINRNRQRDVEDQKKLADMGWHCITVWECQLKPAKREQTLNALDQTLTHIYLADRTVRYKLPEDDAEAMVAEDLRLE